MADQISILNWLSRVPKPDNSNNTKTSHDINTASIDALSKDICKRKRPETDMNKAATTPVVSVVASAAAMDAASPVTKRPRHETDVGLGSAPDNTLGNTFSNPNSFHTIHAINAANAVKAVNAVSPLDATAILKQVLSDPMPPPVVALTYDVPETALMSEFSSTPVATQFDSTETCSSVSRPKARHQLSSMALEAEGIVEAYIEDATGQLSDLYASIVEIGIRAKGIISSVQRPAIEKAFRGRDRSGAVRVLPPDSAYDHSPARDSLGPTPQLDDILNIVHEAALCERHVLAEQGWNCAVHFPLLRLALHGSRSRRKQLLDFVPCTKAPITLEYLPAMIQNMKMVDFCVLFLPDQSENISDADAGPAVQRLRKHLPLGSINQSGFLPLACDPIALSVATKRDGGNDGEGTLQVSLWHAAQWKMLANLRKHDSFPENSDDLPLPAVMVVGQEWYFVATTRKGRKTILWSKVRLGTTENYFEVYKLVYGLQRVLKYATDVYWPWYKRAILGLSVDTGACKQ